ncbi:hypothetical protein ABCS02_14090 [Microbacterium sp. X-17]|uniref:hypothetical protein n=1 Tax=Microbacterium sp. X-17 TaxID=3144404 RepID=UPI0031F4FC65
MTEIRPLVGSQVVSLNQPVSRGLARRAQRELEGIAVRAVIAAATEDANAFVTSVALTRAASLSMEAQGHIERAPLGTRAYVELLEGYVAGAKNRLSRGI